MRLRRILAVATAFVLAGAASASAQVQGEWTSAGAMLSPRETHALAQLANHDVLAIGGFDNTGTALSSSELFDPVTNGWTSTGAMATAREYFAAVTLPSGEVLAVGGLDASTTPLASAELYNPVTGTWSPAGSLSVARYAHTATLLKTGKVLVTGGCSAVNCTAATTISELYDPATNAWSTTGALNTARFLHHAVRLNDGTVLAIGGDVSGTTSTCERYNPSTGAWAVAASETSQRYQGAATLLPSGKVLATGGAAGKYPMNSAELFDPVANTWTPTGAMTVGRYAHVATALPDGTVAIAGGVGQPDSCGKDCTSYIPTAAAEIYNEATGTFAKSASLARALAYQSAIALSSGRALTTGGIGTTSVCCTVVADAEVYTPLTLTFSAASLNFGLIQVGGTSATQGLTVNNVSAHSVTFKTIAAGGDFSQTNDCPATLSAGQSCAVTVAFKPTAAGNRGNRLTLIDNSPGSASQSIPLYGAGETLALGFTPATINAGSVVVGSDSVSIATLTNDGAAPVTISGISIAPSNTTYTQTNNCPSALAVQQTCAIEIVFRPPDVSTYKATLSVANGAGASATLALRGIGLDN